MRDKSRKTLSISEVDGIDEHGNIRLNTLFEFVEDKELSTKTKVVGRLVRTDNPVKYPEKLIAAGKDVSIFDKSRFN